MSSLIAFIVAFILTDFVKSFIEPQGYGSFYNNNRYPRQFENSFGMNNFGFSPPIPAAASSWNPYSAAGMAPMNPMGFNARTSFGFGFPNFGGFGGGIPMDMVAPEFPNYPSNNGYSGFGEFVPSNNNYYRYGNQWPYYPNNNNNKNNGFTQKPYFTIPTLPSSAINSNTFTTTTPTVPLTSFSK